MKRSSASGIQVGINADTCEGRAVSEDDGMLFVMEYDGSFTSLGSYYLWLNTGNELLRSISYQAGMRLIPSDVQLQLTDRMIEKLYRAVYMKLNKLSRIEGVDDHPITQTKLPLCPDSNASKWFKDFITAMNQVEERR